MRILIVHADLEVKGGAESYAEAVINILRHMCHSVDIMDISTLKRSEDKKISFSSYFYKKISKIPGISLLKYALVCRVARRHFDDYDLVFGTYGELPKANVPSIRILHAPSIFSGDLACLRVLGVVNRGIAYVLIRKFYSFICRLIASPHMSASDGVVTITNSLWTKKFIFEKFGIRANYVIYPKVDALIRRRSTYPPSNMKFVLIGRIVRNKRIEDAMSIISSLRERKYDVKLTIIGRGKGRYVENLKKACEKVDYINLISDATDAQLQGFIQAAQYGLHTYQNEHFGIAVAEMCAAGCIPFVYDGGGVVELVRPDILRFGSNKHAVEQIEKVMMASNLFREEISASLQENPILINAINFDAKFAEIIRDVLCSYDSVIDLEA